MGPIWCQKYLVHGKNLLTEDKALDDVASDDDVRNHEDQNAEPSPSPDTLETEHGCSKSVDVQATSIDVAANDDVGHVGHECHNTSNDIEDYFVKIKQKDLTSWIGLDWICLMTTHVLQDILAVLHT